MGVYCIRNTANGKSFVGASIDLPSIINRERAQLRLGVHYTRQLQKDWNEFGPNAFEFEVLDTLTPTDAPNYNPSDDLQVLEAMWLEKLLPFEERGYNARPKPRV